MNLKEYRLFGDDNQYKEITFLTNDGNDIVFTFGSQGIWVVETEGAYIHDINYAYDIIVNGMIQL